MNECHGVGGERGGREMLGHKLLNFSKTVFICLEIGINFSVSRCIHLTNIWISIAGLNYRSRTWSGNKSLFLHDNVSYISDHPVSHQFVAHQSASHMHMLVVLTGSIFAVMHSSPSCVNLLSAKQFRWSWVQFLSKTEVWKKNWP